MLTFIKGWHYLKVIIFRRWMKGMWKGIMDRLRMGIGVIIIGRSRRRMRRSFLVMKLAQRMRSLCRRWMIFPSRLLSRPKISMKRLLYHSQPKSRPNPTPSTFLETILSSPHKTSRKLNHLKNPSQPSISKTNHLKVSNQPRNLKTTSNNNQPRR